METHVFDSSVFKAYDVRGIYPTEVTAPLFHELGRAFVAFLGPGRYAVSRDMRTSSPELATYQYKNRAKKTTPTVQ